MGLETDPTVSFMALDIANDILRLVDDLPNLGRHLTAQLRELTGAQLVVFMRHDEHGDHHVLNISPKRRHELVERPEFEGLLQHISGDEEVRIWGTGDAVPEMISQLGFSSGFLITSFWIS